MKKNTSGTNDLSEVKGTVRLSDDSPAAGAKAAAFDRDLRPGKSETKDGSSDKFTEPQSTIRREEENSRVKVETVKSIGHYEQDCFPLTLNMQGSAVADLQDALQLCMDRSALLAGNATARQQFSESLKPERAAETTAVRPSSS